MYIPKTIHQIWFQGRNQLPKHLQDYHNSWITKHPDYKIIFWDENSIQNLIKNKNIKWITDTYNSYDLMIQKIDFAKYIILYFFGGIYIDMDVKCIQSLDRLLESPNVKTKKVILSNLTYDFFQRILFLLTGKSNVTNLVNNGVIFTVPEHDIILKTMQYSYKYKDNFFKNKSNFLYIFYSTGPLVLSNALIDYTEQNKNNINNIKDIEILDQTYFESCDLGNVNKNACILPNNAIGIHYYESSWSTPREKTLINIYYFITNNLIIIILIIILLIFLSKQK